MGHILLWSVISIVALGVDVLTASFFFSGFTVGGIVALVSQMLGADFRLQLMVFIIVSAISIYTEYNWVRTKLNKTVPKTLKMEEEYIGRVMTAEEDIEYRGRIKLEGIYWTAENEGSPIKKGEDFEITGIKGNKLTIKKQGGID
jgi:membrane protein implicated in regulation of membrane protease activity